MRSLETRGWSMTRSDVHAGSASVRRMLAANAMTPTNLARVLVVEDEADIAALLELHLRDLHASVTRCDDGLRGLEAALGQPWSLIVLDLSLPHLDGLEICARLRLSGNRTPVLILTARSSESDRVIGLNVGADDYLPKPFGVAEFIARVRALLRRLPTNEDNLQRWRIGDLVVDAMRRDVQRGHEHIALTSREFDLLCFLVRNSGKVFNRAQLLNEVWGFSNDSYEHTVSSHINRLRAKLESDPARPRYLLTVWGVGYRFAEH